MLTLGLSLWSAAVSGIASLIPAYAVVNRDGAIVVNRDGATVIADPTARTS